MGAAVAVVFAWRDGVFAFPAGGSIGTWGGLMMGTDPPPDAAE